MIVAIGKCGKTGISTVGTKDVTNQSKKEFNMSFLFGLTVGAVIGVVVGSFLMLYIMDK